MAGKVTSRESNGTAFLELSNPGRLNALSLAMVDQLILETRKIEEKSDIRVVVIHGSNGNFSSGADIGDLASFNMGMALKFHRKMNTLSYQMRNSGKIYIALLEGYALGGGFELSLSADMRICSENTVMGQPEINIGLNAGAGGNAILPRFTGRGNAMYLILTGEKINAGRAVELGIVQKTVPQEHLYEEAENLARRINSLLEESVSLTKMAVNTSYAGQIDAAMDMEALVFSWLNGQKEIKEKMKGFL